MGEKWPTLGEIIWTITPSRRISIRLMPVTVHPGSKAFGV
jgi:hypothetical protein